MSSDLTTSVFYHSLSLNEIDVANGYNVFVLLI